MYILEKYTPSTGLEFITANKLEKFSCARTKAEEPPPLSWYKAAAFFKISDNKCA